MCQGSCIVITGYVFLVLACLTCALSYFAPFWILFESYVGECNSLGRSYGWLTGCGTAGLWAMCTKPEKVFDMPECKWFWDNDFAVEKDLPDWHKATQGLFGAGIILLFIAFFLSTFHICCRCCKESFSIASVIGSFIVTGMLCVGVALGLYGGFMNKDHDVNFDKNETNYYWGFFVGVFGFIVALVAAILFFCENCVNRSHSGYHMTRVV